MSDDLLGNKEKVDILIDRLFKGLDNINGFTGNNIITFMVQQNIAQTRQEALFLAQLLFANKIINNKNNNSIINDDISIFKDDNNSLYCINGNIQYNNINDLYWINFIPFINTDIKRKIHLQPATRSMSPVMKYAQIYNKFAPKDTHGISPMDKYNKELISNVHPSNWQSPTPPSNGYNLIAIGAGAAGLVSAITASRLGGKSAVIDSGLFGGDCLNTGCIPSKSLLKCAKLIYDIKIKNQKSNLGLKINGKISIDFNVIMQRMRRIRAEISYHDACKRFSDEPYNIDVYLGNASFVNNKCIKVNDKLLYFDKCVICTGAVSNVPPIRGINTIQYLTSHSVWNLNQFPTNLGVIGCGPIGCELAQSFSLFGSNVIMIDMMDRILIKEDVDGSNIIKKSMIECGVQFELNTKVIAVENINNNKICVITDNGKRFIFDELLVSTGRKPNVENLNLSATDIKYDTVNGIVVNDFLETTCCDIYAAGDCCNNFQFTHMVDSMAKIVVQNALFYGKKRVSSLIIPWCTYTFPSISHVGLYENDLKNRNIEYDIIKVDLTNNGRSICDGESLNHGFIKIFCDKNSDKIFGATIVSENAGDQISEITLAMQANIGLNKISSTIHPYPTIAEGIKHCGDAYNGSKITPKIKQILSKILKQRLISKL